MTSLSAKAPCRIDLFGGTLDLWPLYLWFQPAATANLAISIFTECHIDYRPKDKAHPKGQVDVTVSIENQPPQKLHELGPLHSKTWKDPFRLPLMALRSFLPDFSGAIKMELKSQAPQGSGLAASSSLMISLLSALNASIGRGCTPLQIQRMARDIESQVLQTPAGEQDYFPALFGGLNVMGLHAGEIAHTKLAPFHPGFQDELLIFYTGQSHHSGLTNWEIFQKAVSGDKMIRDGMKKLAENSQRGVEALQKQDFDAFKLIVRNDWEVRKNTFPKLSTPVIEKCEEIFLNNSVESFKVCGAAAGGCMFAFVPKKKMTQVKDELKREKLQLLQAQFCHDGVTIK